MHTHAKKNKTNQKTTRFLPLHATFAFCNVAVCVWFYQAPFFALLHPILGLPDKQATKFLIATGFAIGE